MNPIKLNENNIFKIIIGLLTVLLLTLIISIVYYQNRNPIKITMGGRFYKQFSDREGKDTDKYFRPSKLPSINDRFNDYRFFDKFYGKKPSEITLPSSLFKTPEDTIINYFSLLREAANPVEGKGAGCGTLGNAQMPYPVAYNFLSSKYRDKLNYTEYLKSFENNLHINLIKLKKVPELRKNLNTIKYFVEIETIKGTEKNISNFAYYYGFIEISKEGNLYKISDVQFFEEDFLCAPYHGWSHNAEYVVDIKYGDWCKLVKERYPTKQEGYVKNIYFKGTDGNDYKFIFFQLTNDTDIEIAQYEKDKKENWNLIKIDPGKCL
ncbi:hypothetical protein LL033_00100 [Clostridium estertheticum]|uniref:hypothetical protein n=1 Tax=Clostridium estertheticum TaxID=238834 RepID=UPI001C0D071C|nr:hypothetical protein [Clostridium estertheticum]MBU3215036.1 hypothetical protein [Clostridium estertheticum]WAG55673.1 hypothetical protein LL033_00100 [Clostridium estertheticum]